MNRAINNELVITRVFDAPRELVWKAWSDPELYKRWWGPKFFTCPAAKIDFRVGGKYISCMRSAQGHEFWSTGTYLEIVPFERIVYSDSFADENGNTVHASYYNMPGDDWPLELMVTVQLEDYEGRTKMTLTHTGIPAGMMSEMTGQGWNESFDKMVEIFKNL